MKHSKKTENNFTALKRPYIFLGLGMILIVGLLVIKPFSGESGGKAAKGEDLIIPKNGVSETATFYPYKAGKTNMEILAVKAGDGSIRTAFNTCQVCYDSGKGYYKQQGSELVCQNCGNRFKIEQVEKIRGGCNPVPIMQENKTEDGANIVIAADFLEANKDLFGNWKK